MWLRGHMFDNDLSNKRDLTISTSYKDGIKKRSLSEYFRTNLRGTLIKRIFKEFMEDSLLKDSEKVRPGRKRKKATRGN